MLGTIDHGAGKQFIPADSDEEEVFVLAVYNALIQTIASAPLGIQATFDRLYNQIALAWNANTKTSKAGSNPTHWWTQECELAKHVYEHTHSNEDHKIYLDVTARARKAFFDQKIQNMMATRCPWEGMRWISPWCPPAFPSIRDQADDPIKDPETFFSTCTGTSIAPWPQG